MYVTPVDTGVIEASTRLVECLAQPSDVELLAPLIMDEILIRVLRSPVGVHVAKMGLADSDVHRVGRAISWFRQNFAQPMKVDELAAMVHMSASSFHEHFKAVTSMSPLHYQKVLRLQEARRLMLSTMMDAKTAGQRVGYLSASQFSRDYSRLFGNPPSSDVSRIRSTDQALVGPDGSPNKNWQCTQTSPTLATYIEQRRALGIRTWPFSHLADARRPRGS